MLGHFLETRHGAAEGVLGVVALMLVVWLLWPEEQSPHLVEQRTVSRDTVKADDADRARPVLEAGRAASGSLASRSAEDRSAYDGGAADGAGIARAQDGERRRIARPSELADRLDAGGRRPGQAAGEPVFSPAPQRPADAAVAATGNPGIDAVPIEPEAQRQAEAAVAASSVQSALAEVIDGLQAEGQASADLAVPPPDGSVGGETDRAAPPFDMPVLSSELLDVPVLSSESLDAEPLPEVDLSDLDSLVPLDQSETTAVAALDPAQQTAPAETPTPPVAALPPDAAPRAAVEPFAEEAPAEPSTDVRHRPRDDAPSWLRNAVAAAVDDDRPIIAIVIDDLGLNRPNTAAFNHLPAPLTLAFLPYAGRLEAQTEAAHAAGHELMVHLPMEPVGSDWPGPDALTTRIDRKEFTARLIKNLTRFQGFVGVNNHMGSRLTADRSRMNVVMRELRERDVLFLDSKTSARSVASDVAASNGVPNTTRDVFLDHVIDLAAIKRQLARAERVARQYGSAVAIGHPHGATIQALREWLPGLEERGFALAPISAVVARRACNHGVLIAAETCGRYLQARDPAAAVAAKDG